MNTTVHWRLLLASSTLENNDLLLVTSHNVYKTKTKPHLSVVLSSWPPALFWHETVNVLPWVSWLSDRPWQVYGHSVLSWHSLSLLSHLGQARSFSSHTWGQRQPASSVAVKYYKEERESLFNAHLTPTLHWWHMMWWPIVHNYWDSRVSWPVPGYFSD